VRNGEVLARAAGDGKRTQLSISAAFPPGESSWVAARVTAAKQAGEPDIQGHTNPLYLLHEGRPVIIPSARQSLARKWKAEVDWFSTGPLQFRTEAARAEFFERAAKALDALNR